VIESVAL